MKKKVFIWGGTGNYKVNKEILEFLNYKIIALFDNNVNLINPYEDVPFIGGQKDFENWITKKAKPSDYNFLVTMGGGHGKSRIEIQDLIKSFGANPIISIHPSAYVSLNARIGEGSQIFAHAAICVESFIGKACIINTSASIDHECILGDGVTIGPGVRMAGLVQVGNYTDIYTGAIIFPRITIGTNVTIGAGSVVTKNIPDNVMVYGNPAKIISKNI
jgi:sugar O-acyltransferase (sialic acid O-acetyltransferase NeuD family)